MAMRRDDALPYKTSNQNVEPQFKRKKGRGKNSGSLEHKKPQQNKMHAQRLAMTHTHNQELETFKRKWLAIYLTAFKPNLSLLYALDRKIAPSSVFIQKSSWKYKCLNSGSSEHHLPNILFKHLATSHLPCYYLIHTKKSWLKLGVQAWINGRNELNTVVQHSRQIINMVSSSQKVYKRVNWNFNESF